MFSIFAVADRFLLYDRLNSTKRGPLGLAVGPRVFLLLLEDIPLCLKYSDKIKLYMYSV